MIVLPQEFERGFKFGDAAWSACLAASAAISLSSAPCNEGIVRADAGIGHLGGDRMVANIYAAAATDFDQAIRRLEGYSGVKLMEAFDIPDLDKSTKRECRYARQNRIHVSPSFMIDGIVQPDMSSGDAVADWVKRLA